MVRLLPDIQEGLASNVELDAFLRLLASLEGAARTDDLRFLDAWNIAYEALAHGSGQTVDLDGFLHAYMDLLAHHLERLDG